MATNNMVEKTLQLVFERRENMGCSNSGNMHDTLDTVVL